MLVTKDIKKMRTQLASWRVQKQKISFVPTMGNLHQGHLSLIELAKQQAQRVVVSIYVNPLQFSADEDLDSYPRTLSQDLKRLEQMGCDLVFTPNNQMIYPQGEQQSTFVQVPHLFHLLEGAVRPHFFRGVATVVLKLFNLVQPDIAIFGEKDYQQLLIIKQMVKDLNLPVQIIGGAIVREACGLAMSSRNQYLSVAEREKSCLLSRTLADFCRQIEQGDDIDTAKEQCEKNLQRHGFDIDYVSIRTQDSFDEIQTSYQKQSSQLIILVAVRLGSVRLLDNVKFG